MSLGDCPKRVEFVLKQQSAKSDRIRTADVGNAVLGDRDEFAKVSGRPHALQRLDPLPKAKAIDEGDDLFEITFGNEMVEIGIGILFAVPKVGRHREQSEIAAPEPSGSRGRLAEELRTAAEFLIARRDGVFTGDLAEAGTDRSGVRRRSSAKIVTGDLIGTNFVELVFQFDALARETRLGCF
ncbi:hypothetical protein [Mesorhizobium sp.]|uniref:hypothetical protein n=1 Tax=Mesorhizobium sp. TaxID=1871066 RepID=UPI00257DC867|nr:hypothetical protein [Mesorhizobium sp.]